MKYNSKKMKKIEKEYAAMKIKEQEEMVELRVSDRKQIIEEAICNNLREDINAL